MTTEPCEACGLPVNTNDPIVSRRLQERIAEVGAGNIVSETRGRLAWFHPRCADRARSTGEWTVAHREA